jgi:large subunit ribosomal protein L10
VKNTLALRATKGTALETMAKHFVGATAVAYNRSNPVALAKVLTAFAKTNPNSCSRRRDRGSGRRASAIKAIAELPSREELWPSCSSCRAAALVTVLNGPVRNLAGVVADRGRSRNRYGRRRPPREIRICLER